MDIIDSCSIKSEFNIVLIDTTTIHAIAPQVINKAIIEKLELKTRLNLEINHTTMDFITQTAIPIGSNPDSFGSKSSFSDSEKSDAVNQAEAELKEMQKQIESYNLLLTQLSSQQKMAIKKLADMDEQIKELNKTLERERSEVTQKQKEIQERRAKLQNFMSDEDFDPFAGADPFDGNDPFKADDVNLTLPEDDPFNPSSASKITTKSIVTTSDDPFAPTRW